MKINNYIYTDSEIIKNNEGKNKKNYISNNEKFNDMLINYLKNI